MKNILLAGVLLASLAFFGCLGGPGAPAPTAQAGAPAGGTPTPAGPAETPLSTQAAGTPAPTQPPQAQEIAGKTFSELLALGASVECDVAVATEAGMASGKAFIKGDRSRIEIVVERDGEKVQVTQVYKENTMYITIPSEMKSFLQQLLGKTCEWMKFDAKPATPVAGAGTEPVDKSELDDKTRYSFTCRPAAVGDEKFATPNECSMSEVMKKTTSGYPGYPG